jgi:PAS domain S-box-containing protein
MLPSIYNGIDTAIFVLDYTEEGEFIFRGLNPAHERISGMKSSEVEGKTHDELYPILPKEACEAVKANYQRCVDAGESIVYEEMIPMKGRNIGWLTRMTPLRSREGRIYRLIGSASDISELKENQQILSLRNEEILAQKEELERLYAKESQFSDKLDQKLKVRTADLVERVKELNCQFEIDQHSMVDDFSELDFLKSSAESIKNGFLHPEFTEVQIEIDKIRISTTNNPKSHWVLNQALKDKTLIGKLLIYYTRKTDRNPFLEEERALAESISVKIARVVYANRLTTELKSANEKHRLLNEKYIDQNNKLKKKNEKIRTEVAGSVT